jgi:hypothetical protein
MIETSIAIMTYKEGLYHMLREQAILCGGVVDPLSATIREWCDYPLYIDTKRREHSPRYESWRHKYP